jgi:hypothetical protein
MLTFIIPFLVGTIVGFLIRGKPRDTFAITTGKRAAWAIGFGFGGLLIGMPIGLAISSTTGPQIAGLVGTGLGLGVLNILSIENPTYKKWSDKNALSWLIGGVVALVFTLLFVGKQIPKFAQSADEEDQTIGTSATATDSKDISELMVNATRGDADAQLQLGLKYSLGHEVSKNDAEAVKWYRLAADQGNVFAQLNLGVMYDDGEGVAENDAEAVKWYRLAAAQGDADAQYKLGVLYVFGSGVSQSKVDAYFWWDLAAARGRVDAKRFKDLIAEKMTREQIAEAQRRSAAWKPKKQ